MIMNATIEFALKDGKMVLPQSAQRSQKKKKRGSYSLCGLCALCGKRAVIHQQYLKTETEDSETAPWTCWQAKRIHGRAHLFPGRAQC